MNPFRTLFLAFLFALASACGGADSGDAEHGVSTDALAATGFVTTNPTPPETAKPCKQGMMCDADGRPYGFALLGEPLPDFTGTLAGGGTFRTDMLDRWTVVYVWGIWCGDCMADAPYVAALSSQVREIWDLDFLSVHVPASETRTSDEEMFGKFGSVDAYFEDRGYGYPVVVDRTAELRETLKVGWTPTYMLVDPDGIVRGFRTDLSVAGGEPVAEFLADVERVRSADRAAKYGAFDAGELFIGPDGAGGVTGQTPFTLDALKAAYPGMEIISDTLPGTGDDAMRSVMLVRGVDADGSAGKMAFQVEPDWTSGHVALVRTLSPLVKGPEGQTIGETKLASLDAAARARCAFGQERYADALLCPDGDTGRFVKVFMGGAGFDGLLKDAQPGYEGEAMLMEMQYLPPLPPG